MNRLSLVDDSEGEEFIFLFFYFFRRGVANNGRGFLWRFEMRVDCLFDDKRDV